MRRLPPLSCLRAFEAAARHGSFKQAAAELGVTPTAVSHQIRILEDHAGLAVFQRGVRKVSLTEDGARLYPILRVGFDAFEAAFLDITQQAKHRRVVVSATNAFMAKWLAPRAARFHDAHPQIDLQLHASDVAVDLEKDGVDVAIRYGRGPFPGMHAEPLFSDRFAPVASPKLDIRTPTEMDRVALIHFDWKRAHPLNPTWKAWFDEAELKKRAGHGELRFSDESHAIQAAISGQGIALLSLVLVAEELASGLLVQPFGPTLEGHGYYLITQARDETPPAVRAAVDWLKSEASLSVAIS